LSRGVFAVFGSHTVATINTLRSFSGAFRLPFVSTGLPVSIPHSRRRRRHHGGYRGSSGQMRGEDVLLEDDDDDYDNDKTVGYEVYMRPLYARAVVDLLKHYDCRQVWYLYNSNEGTLALRLHSDNTTSGTRTGSLPVFTARRNATRCIRYSISICPSHAGIVSKRMNIG